MPQIAKDAFGQEVQVGDLVAYNPPYYKGLCLGQVIHVNGMKSVRILREGVEDRDNYHARPSSYFVKMPNDVRFLRMLEGTD